MLSGRFECWVGFWQGWEPRDDGGGGEEWCEVLDECPFDMLKVQLVGIAEEDIGKDVIMLDPRPVRSLISLTISTAESNHKCSERLPLP